MSDEKNQNELVGWLSTYGLITAQRILERYKIKLTPAELVQAIKSFNSFYHRLLRVPMRNVFNGIILQQARDYQLFAQKLFIDYLLSGESGKEESSPGGATRDDLEEERLALVAKVDAFHEEELAHEKLIAQSQSTLIKNASEWNTLLESLTESLKKKLLPQNIVASSDDIHKALITLLTSYNLNESRIDAIEIWASVEKILNHKITEEIQQIFTKEMQVLSEFSSEAENDWAKYQDKITLMSDSFRRYRTDFYDAIVKTTALIQLLPDYKNSDAQKAENLESLYFDPAIGEKMER